MNAERLHAIGNAVADELSAGQIPGLLRQLVTALQQSVQEPAQPAHQQSVSSLRQQLNEALEEAQSNHFSPAWREALEEMGIADVLGTTLATRITSIFERNEITPSAAVEELTPLADRVEALAQALEQIRTGLELSASVPRS